MNSFHCWWYVLFIYFVIFETGFLCVALAILDSLGRTDSSSVGKPTFLCPRVLGLKACTIIARHSRFYELQIFFYWVFISFTFPTLSQKSPTRSPHPLPYPPNPTSSSWGSPVLRHIKFARPMGLSFYWWLTRSSSDSYAARHTSSGGLLVSSYCCSTYRVADPFSSLGTFSSSSIGPIQ